MVTHASCNTTAQPVAPIVTSMQNTSYFASSSTSLMVVGPQTEILSLSDYLIITQELGSALIACRVLRNASKSFHKNVTN